MPTYRKLHTKILDSYDFAEMPNDFTRLFWLLLIVVVDSEGRAIDQPSWIKARMFPLRTDVSNKQIEEALTWLDKNKMIRRYQVCGRNYFHVLKFKTYQTGTEREARSVLPAPEALMSNSGEIQEEVKTTSTATVSVYESVNESASVNDPVIEGVPEDMKTPEFIEVWRLWDTFRKEIKKPITKTTKKQQLKKLSEYSVETAVKMIEQSIQNGWQGIFEIKTGGNGNNHPEALPSLRINTDGSVNL